MIFADKALLPDGWAKNVGIEIWGGLIGSIAKDVQPKSGDTHVSALVAGMPNVHSHAFQGFAFLWSRCTAGTPCSTVMALCSSWS